MRGTVVLVAVSILLAGLLVMPSPPARAAEVPKLYLTVDAGANDEAVFDPDKIVVPSFPIILNVTLVYNASAAGTMGYHTFTIRDSEENIRVDIRVDSPGDRASDEFAVNSSTEFYHRGVLYEAQTEGGAILFVCVPHEALLMKGTIELAAGEVVEREEIGLFLRAYWIGLIGLAAMLVWIGVTYFIIKGGTAHGRDHRDHIRRGLT